MKIDYTDEGVRVLRPTEKQYLTNGETYSKCVYLGVNASADEWYEVDEIPQKTYSDEVEPEIALNELLEVIGNDEN